MRELILEKFDKNYDGRLEINEVSVARRLALKVRSLPLLSLFLLLGFR